MIEKMKAVCVVSRFSEKDSLLTSLRDLGVLHIAEKRTANAIILERFSLISKLLLELKDYVSKDNETSEPLSDERFEVLRQNGLDEPKSYLCPSTTSAGWQAAGTGSVLSAKAVSYGYFLRDDVTGDVISTSTCGGSSVIAADGQTKTAGTWNHDKKGAYLRIDSSVTRPGGASWVNEIKTSNGGIDAEAADRGGF